MFKKVLIVLAIAFAAYYLITEPESAANAVYGAGAAIVSVFESIITFINTLFSNIFG